MRDIQAKLEGVISRSSQRTQHLSLCFDKRTLKFLCKRHIKANNALLNIQAANLGAISQSIDFVCIPLTISGSLFPGKHHTASSLR